MQKAGQRMLGVVVVTGASRGLGLEFVRQLALTGVDVVACCRNLDMAGLCDIAASIRPITMDVTDAASVNRMAESLQGRPVDLLINNAAIRGATGGLSEIDRDGFLDVMAVNVLGPLLVTRALLPNLRSGRGVVANIGSRAGSMVEGIDPDGDYAYKCSKAALNMVTTKLSDDTGLTVLSLHPGWIKTDMGGPDAELDTAESAAALLGLLAKVGPADTRSFRAFDGRAIAW